MELPPSNSEFAREDFPLQELTREIIASCYAVHNEFGYGFFESVYRRALAVELRYRGIPVAEEVPYELFYRGVSVGVYRADLVVDSRVIVETKTGLVLDPIAPVQLLNCLVAARLSLGLVLHFGPRAGVKRVVSTQPHRRMRRFRSR